MGAVPEGSQRNIRMLGPEVVERIAAGEVIERPASVVRELIENALDAGATAVRIELREGGLRLLRVTDDGCGIASDELTLAVTPHATSKVYSVADLERVHTLGFRGEALASVAGIAELHLSSATGDDGVAHTLTLRTGETIDRGMDARPRGTTITVRELFSNLPARRAMLRGPRSEQARALAVVRAYALAHPGVRFTAIADGHVVLQTPGTSLHDAVRTIYGTDVARALLPIGPMALDHVAVVGWIAARTFSQPDRGHVLVSVNGRPVSNRALVAGLEAGYRPLLRKGRHPIAMIALEVEPDQVDVNVHPAKAEVLLRAERAVITSLRDAVHTALGTAPSQATPAWIGTGGAYGRSRQYPLPMVRRRRGARVGEPRTRYVHPMAEQDDTPQKLPPLEPLGQLDAALIIARAPEGHLYLVDQHRAHERLLYEALRSERPPFASAPWSSASVALDESAGGSGQLLLEPLVVELTPRQAQLLHPRLDELAGIGLIYEPFGGASFLVRALPALPGAAVGVASLAGALASDAAEDADDWFEQFRISLACRTALKRGLLLSPAEQQALLTELRTAAAPAFCPHGSPIVMRCTRSYLARAFEW